MDQIEIYKATLEAALKVEDEETERLTDRGQVRMAAEHFHRARGIMYAIQLMVDPHYLQKQAEILEVIARPAPKSTQRRLDERETIVVKPF